MNKMKQCTRVKNILRNNALMHRKECLAHFMHRNLFLAQTSIFIYSTVYTLKMLLYNNKYLVCKPVLLEHINPKNLIMQ